LRVLIWILAILAAIVLVLLIPAVVRFSQREGERRLEARWLFVKKTILPAPEKESASEAEKKKKKHAEEHKKTDPVAALRDNPITDLIEEGTALVGKCARPVRRLFRRTTVAKLSLRLVAVGRDAADTAIRYGRYQTVIPYTVALLDRTVRLRPERIDVIPGFAAEKETFSLSGEVRLIPLAVLLAAANLALCALPVYRRLTRKKAAA